MKRRRKFQTSIILYILQLVVTVLQGRILNEILLLFMRNPNLLHKSRICHKNYSIFISKMTPLATMTIPNSKAAGAELGVSHNNIKARVLP